MNSEKENHPVLFGCLLDKVEGKDYVGIVKSQIKKMSKADAKILKAAVYKCMWDDKESILVLFDVIAPYKIPDLKLVQLNIKRDTNTIYSINGINLIKERPIKFSEYKDKIILQGKEKDLKIGTVEFLKEIKFDNYFAILDLLK